VTVRRPGRGLARAGRAHATRARATRTRALVVLTALAAAAAAGCGEATFEATHDSKEQAASAVRTWLGACASEREDAILEPLPSGTRKLVVTAPGIVVGCERVADLSPAPRPKTEELRAIFRATHVEHVLVDGGIGTAVLRAPDGRISELELEVDRGAWRLSNPPIAAL
jgi:hypothetical protein